MFPTHKKKIPYLAHGFSDIPSSWGSSVQIALKNNGFQFSHMQRGVKQKISKFQKFS